MDKQLQQTIDSMLTNNINGALIVDQFGYTLASRQIEPKFGEYVKNIADCAIAIKNEVPTIVIETSESQAYIIKPGQKFSLCIHQV